MHALSSRRLLALATAAALVPAALAAQATTRPTFGISAGAAFPTGDFGKELNTGFNVSGHIGIRPGMSPVGVRIEGMYNQFDFKSFSDVQEKVIGGTANLVFMTPAPEGSIRPYVIAGAGVYNIKASGGGVSDESVTKFGLNGGAGLDLALSGINVFLEARYHAVFSKETNALGTTFPNANFIPLVVGVRF